jgi:all-trans-retinol 13,14-reductase
LNGGYYPVGGATIMAEGFLKTVQAAGGEALTRADVDTVIVKGGKAVGVRMKTGEEFFAPKVISAIGAKATVERLVPTEFRETPWGQGIERLGQSPAYLCMYLGFEGDVRAAGATNANQWFMESWDMEWKEWHLDDPKSIAPVLYVSYPSLKDPAHVEGPNQRHTGEVVTFVPWNLFDKWKDTRRGFRAEEYTAFKKGIEDRMMAQMRRHQPKLMDLVKHYELSTPLSTTHFTHAPTGAIYGLEATPERFMSPHISTRTPVKNLFMAGGDVATLGITGALFGGFLAASTIEPKLMGQMK